MRSLSDVDQRHQFTNAFSAAIDSMHDVSEDMISIEDSWEQGKAAMQVASQSLPREKRTANHPWISSETLSWIEARQEARALNDHAQERALHRQVRKSCKRDKTKWFNSLLDQGDWKQIKKLKNPRKAKCRRLRNSAGDLVESDDWADTMAAHLETYNGEFVLLEQ